MSTTSARARRARRSSKREPIDDVLFLGEWETVARWCARGSVALPILEEAAARTRIARRTPRSASWSRRACGASVRPRTRRVIAGAIPSRDAIRYAGREHVRVSARRRGGDAVTPAVATMERRAREGAAAALRARSLRRPRRGPCAARARPCDREAVVTGRWQVEASSAPARVAIVPPFWCRRERRAAQRAVRARTR